MTADHETRGGPSRRVGTRFTCPHYQPLPGEKRCRDYQNGGTCARPDEFMCREWARANGHALPDAGESGVTPSEPSFPQRDLFGNVVPDAVPASKPSMAHTKERRSGGDHAPLLAPHRLRIVSDEGLASFRALGVEVRLSTEEVGDIWIVSEYSGADRQELRADHAVTLAAACAAFPGARVTEFVRREGGEQ